MSKSSECEFRMRSSQEILKSNA